jgi:Protein of unknown function (DUF2934)
MAHSAQETAKKKSTTTSNGARRATFHETRMPTHGAIAARARELYEKSGYAGGRDLEFWLEAERQLRIELNA